MSVTEIKNPTVGIVGHLYEIECKETNSILIFQLARKTDMISKDYIDSANKVLKQCLPDKRTAVILGCDVNVYELGEADSVILRLKGLI